MRTISTLIALTGVNSIDLADQSIRFGNDRCAVKFGTGYNTGDAVLIKSCASLTSPNKHKKGKFQWEFNAETRQIVSVGSKLSESSVFCWTLSKYVGTTRSSDYKQRVYVQMCDDESINQKFDISESGVISVADENWNFLCAGADPLNDDILTFSKCAEPEVEEAVVADVVETENAIPGAADVNPGTGLNSRFTQQQEALRLMAIVNANKSANKAKIKAEEVVVEANKAANTATKLSRKSNQADFVLGFRDRKWAEKIEVNCKKRENKALQRGDINHVRPCDRLIEGSNACNVLDENAVCHHTWDCEDTVCECGNGFYGDDCQTADQCVPINPCQNGGACSMFSTGYTCECEPGFTGSDCEVQIPCFLAPCQQNSACTNAEDFSDYTCACPSDYTSKDCETPIPCEHTDCGSGTCENNVNFTNFEDFTCACDAAHTGVNCEILLPCSANPCSADPNSVCTDTEDFSSYTCECSDDFYGEICDTASPCNAINNPCQNGAECENSGDFQSAICNCQEGYTGDTCSDEFFCWSEPCLNSGNCTETIAESGYECGCTEEFAGPNCEFTNLCFQGIDCNTGECTHNAVFDDTFCTCPGGYSGDFCEVAPSVCSEGVCNGQGCINREDGTGYDCHCAPSHTGPECMTGALPCNCETEEFQITEYSATGPDSGSSDFSNWELVTGGIVEDQQAFTDGKSNLAFRWRNIPDYLAGDNCYTMKMVARQNECGGGCGHGTNNFTVKWTNSCATTVYVWAANFFLGSEDFTGGFAENVPEGWTQLQNGTEDNTHFQLFFNGNFNIPQNIVNKVDLLGGINEVTFPVEDLWVGGLAICREQSGPCGYPQTCANSEDLSSYTCSA